MNNSSNTLDKSLKIYYAIEDVLDKECLLDLERDKTLVVALCSILMNTIDKLLVCKIVEEKKGVEIQELIFEINKRFAQELKEKIESENIKLREDLN